VDIYCGDTVPSGSRDMSLSRALNAVAAFAAFSLLGAIVVGAI
jgi:hypothetical protein